MNAQDLAMLIGAAKEIGAVSDIEFNHEKAGDVEHSSVRVYFRDPGCNALSEIGKEPTS